MTNAPDPIDPRGLIREAFRMEGLGPQECRTIFLDWALGLPDSANEQDLIAQLLRRYADQPAGHPMTAVLKEGVAAPREARPSRRRIRRS